MWIAPSDIYGSAAQPIVEAAPKIISPRNTDAMQPSSSLTEEIQKGSFAPISYQQLQERYKLCMSSELRGKNATESLYRIQPIKQQLSAIEKKYLSKRVLADKPSDCTLYHKLAKNGDSVSVVITKKKMGRTSIEFRGAFPISLSK